MGKDSESADNDDITDEIVVTGSPDDSSSRDVGELSTFQDSSPFDTQLTALDSPSTGITAAVTQGNVNSLKTLVAIGQPGAKAALKALQSQLRICAKTNNSRVRIVQETHYTLPIYDI